MLRLLGRWSVSLRVDGKRHAARSVVAPLSLVGIHHSVVNPQGRTESGCSIG
jgi:hypothetical protein